MESNKQSKNLTRISFAVLFTITLSLAFHAPLPEASAADTWTAATTTDVGANNMYGVSMSDASNGVSLG